METRESLFVASQNFFSTYNVDLQITDGAVRRIADEAAKSPRIGARALKGVFGKIIKPYEFDPFNHPNVSREAESYRLELSEELVREALKPEIDLYR